MSRPLAAIPLLAVLAGALSVPAGAVTLDIAQGAFPDINCKFDHDCTITVTDTTADIALPGAVGKGFLQSRTWPIGQKRTAGAGLFAYFYRIDLRNVVGAVAQPCITELSLRFGPIAPLDYDNDGDPDDLVVATSGGIGNVAPSSATLTATSLKLIFATPVCSGSAPSKGDSSLFIGLASKKGRIKVTAKAKVTPGTTPLSLAARAPKP